MKFSQSTVAIDKLFDSSRRTQCNRDGYRSGLAGIFLNRGNSHVGLSALEMSIVRDAIIKDETVAERADELAALNDVLDTMIKGDLVSPEQETSVIENRWKP